MARSTTKRRSSPPSRPAAASHFSKIFFQNVPEEDCAQIDTAARASVARDHEKLMKGRKPGKPVISVYVPPLKKGVWDSGRTVIDIVNDDMPFLLDSVAAELGRRQKVIRILLHPILHVTQDKAEAPITALAKGNSKTRPQSHIHIELQGAMPAPLVHELKESLQAILTHVKRATEDWPKMREQLKQAQEGLSFAPDSYTSEDIEDFLYFLEYLYMDNFTLLGCRAYKKSGGKNVTWAAVKSSGLGLLNDTLEPPFITVGPEGLPEDLLKLQKDATPVKITKLPRRSTVHRAVPLDAVTVRQYDEKGTLCGFYLFVGLFTSVTYSRSIADIPYLRRKADIVTQMSGYKAGSHDYKALRHILEKYPRDELFQISIPALLDTSKSILQLQERQRIALYMRSDVFGRYISCLVYVPRDRYDTRLRVGFQKILESELRGTCTNFYTTLDDSILARVMYTISIPGKPSAYDTAAIERKLQDAGRLWSEKLSEALLNKDMDEQKIAHTVHRYGNAFPVSYQESYLPRQAVHDIEKIEAALRGPNFTLGLYRDYTCNKNQLRLKIYNKGAPVILSDVLPLLENMGFRTISELPFEIKPEGACAAVWIHDFYLDMNDGQIPAFNDDTKEKFEDSFTRIWTGVMENDGLNQLVIGAAMDWREISVMRLYVRYLRQTANPFGMRYIERALTRYPTISRHIIDLFNARLNPATSKGSEATQIKLNAAIESSLESVASLDEDRILRSITSLVNASLRTNFFQKGPDGQPKPYISVKFDSKLIGDLPEPRPFREIFVYSPRVEAVHLRSDWVSRGGIRWSDRHEDFRTEILGLMKTQQVKNSVIVPMGAKGGFIVKQPPKDGGRPAYLQEGIECYKIFIRGLLDITDNRKGKKIVPPRDVVRRDGDDPYLVVAADKGTATFSDIANALSVEYGHWLGDAFASGGSAGYDHKKMGITARGAWESVKRHFRELGHDTQTQPFDVIGIGDMGGDVFGNGMLLSDKIKLIGAFNHAHIFADPNPDMAATFKERQRLFLEVKGWDGYDTKKLSKGGRIYARTEKSLTLTPEIMARFEITKNKVTPAELIQAMLRARTDLLWAGGIGTYIKSSVENHADVGDRTNDSLRVDATDIRARVIGEGANLALTQRARIEYAAAGGKLNADFIDNSGGVDSSDHEVNIKILMTGIMANAKTGMTPAARNKLLASMTEEVASLVLRHNYQQSQALSLMTVNAAEDLEIQARFIAELERKGLLNRKLEALPDDKMIEERRRGGLGLTRPELSLIQAHAKILFARDLISSDIPDRAESQPWLLNYFPEPLRVKYKAEILEHLLRREIIATNISFTLVNRMGSTFVKSVMEKTGATAEMVTKAWITAVGAFGLEQQWAEIESFDNKVPAAAQMRAFSVLAKMLKRGSIWILKNHPTNSNMKDNIILFGDAVAQLRTLLNSLATAEMESYLREKTQSYIDDGLPRALASSLSQSRYLAAAFDIIRVARDSGASVKDSAAVYFTVGQDFHLSWLRDQARALANTGHWSGEAIDTLIEQFYTCQAGLAARVLKGRKTSAQNKAALQQAVAAVEPLLAELRRTGSTDMAMLVIAEQRLRGLF